MSLKRTRTEPTTAPASAPASEVVNVEITAIAMVTETKDYWDCARCTRNPTVAAAARGRERGIPSHIKCGHEIVAGGIVAISAQMPLAQPHANMVLDAARDSQRYEGIGCKEEFEKALRCLAAALCVANPSAVVAASYHADKPVLVTSFSVETGNFGGADAAALQAWRDNILKHVQTQWWYMQTPFPATCTHGSEHLHSDLDLVVHWMMHMKRETLYYCEFCRPSLTIAARVVPHDPVAPTASQLASIFTA